MSLTLHQRQFIDLFKQPDLRSVCGLNKINAAVEVARSRAMSLYLDRAALLQKIEKYRDTNNLLLKSSREDYHRVGMTDDHEIERMKAKAYDDCMAMTDIYARQLYVTDFPETGFDLVESGADVDMPSILRFSSVQQYLQTKGIQHRFPEPMVVFHRKEDFIKYRLWSS